MRKFNVGSILWAGALVLGLALGAGHASADTSPGAKKDGGKKEAAKGKPGDACKTNADCDQSSQPQSCRQSKCQVEYPPPPT
jgi:hypothetical protein